MGGGSILQFDGRLIPVNNGPAPPSYFCAMAEPEDRVRKCLAHAKQCHAWAESTRHEKAKDLFPLLENEWRTLAGEIKDIEQRRKFVADAEIAIRQRLDGM